MRDNIYNEDDPGLITKKFWSHVKSNSKSSRLPETMHLDDTFRNKPSEELFNNFFYEQFSGPSNHNTDIHFSNNQVFDIDFKGGGGGGGGVHAFHFGKTYFELGVGGEGQETSRHFKGSFGSIRAILPM